MNFKKIISAVAAAAVAVSAMAVSSFAAVFETSLEESGKPSPEVYYVAGVEGVDYSKVAKVEAVVTTTDYVNGTIGVSCNGAWTTCNQVEASGGTATTWTLDGLSGIDATKDDGSFKEDAVQVQFWWLNAGTVTIDSVKLFDADGNVLQEVPAAEAAPAEEATTEAAPAEDTAAADDADEALDETADEDVVADDADAADEDVVADDTADEDVVVTDDAADEAVVDAPAADADTAAAATGNTSAAVIFSVMAVAGAAAIVAKKRK